LPIDQNSIKDLEEKLETLEKQLRHDTESSKSLSNEKQLFLKQIADLEQQVLNVEEENVALQDPLWQDCRPSRPVRMLKSL